MVCRAACWLLSELVLLLLSALVLLPGPCAQGANLCLQTLARRGVSTPPLRSPSVVCDPSIRLVFKHRGGGWCWPGPCLGGCNQSSWGA